MQNLNFRDEIIVLCNRTSSFSKFVSNCCTHGVFVSNFVYVFHKHFSMLAFYQSTISKELDYVTHRSVSVKFKVSICSSNNYIFESQLSILQNCNSKYIRNGSLVQLVDC